MYAYRLAGSGLVVNFAPPLFFQRNTSEQKDLVGIVLALTGTLRKHPISAKNGCLIPYFLLYSYGNQKDKCTDDLKLLSMRAS